MSYWEECISESFIEVGISATQEQIEKVAEFVEVSHENYGMYSGSDVATSNYFASKESEQKEMIMKIESEHQKEINLLEKQREDRESSLWRRIRALEDEARTLNNQLGSR